MEIARTLRVLIGPESSADSLIKQFQQFADTRGDVSYVHVGGEPARIMFETRQGPINADACVFLFDIQNPMALSDLSSQYFLLSKQYSPTCKFFLLGGESQPVEVLVNWCRDKPRINYKTISNNLKEIFIHVLESAHGHQLADKLDMVVQAKVSHFLERLPESTLRQMIEMIGYSEFSEDISKKVMKLSLLRDIEYIGLKLFVEDRISKLTLLGISQNLDIYNAEEDKLKILVQEKFKKIGIANCLRYLNNKILEQILHDLSIKVTKKNGLSLILYEITLFALDVFLRYFDTSFLMLIAHQLSIPITDPLQADIIFEIVYKIIHATSPTTRPIQLELRELEADLQEHKQLQEKRREEREKRKIEEREKEEREKKEREKEEREKDQREQEEREREREVREREEKEREELEREEKEREREALEREELEREEKERERVELERQEKEEREKRESEEREKRQREREREEREQERKKREREEREKRERREREEREIEERKKREKEEREREEKMEKERKERERREREEREREQLERTEREEREKELREREELERKEREEREEREAREREEREREDIEKLQEEERKREEIEKMQSEARKREEGEKKEREVQEMEIEMERKEQTDREQETLTNNGLDLEPEYSEQIEKTKKGRQDRKRISIDEFDQGKGLKAPKTPMPISNKTLRKTKEPKSARPSRKRASEEMNSPSSPKAKKSKLQEVSHSSTRGTRAQFSDIKVGISLNDLNSFVVADLKQYLIKEDLSIKGLKADLLKRVWDHLEHKKLDDITEKSDESSHSNSEKKKKKGKNNVQKARNKKIKEKSKVQDDQVSQSKSDSDNELNDYMHDSTKKFSITPYKQNDEDKDINPKISEKKRILRIKNSPVPPLRNRPSHD